MPGEKVLVVEDDPSLLRGLKDNLAFEGYQVLTAADGDKGLTLALSERPDLILLDIMLPSVNGYEVCRLVRKEKLDMPIIMLTAKGQEADIILGLNVGADDYVTKPFSIKELLARVKAFLRRRRVEEAVVQRFGEFELDRTSRRLVRKGREMALSPKEFGLLDFLARQPEGRSRARRSCARSGLQRVRHRPQRGSLHHHAAPENRARSGAATLIRTIREIGYRFEPPEAE